MTKNEQRKYLTIAAAVVGVYVLYKGNQAAETVKKVVTEDLNPANQGNIVNQAFEAVTNDKEGRPLGVRLYDWLNPDAPRFEP